MKGLPAVNGLIPPAYPFHNRQAVRLLKVHYSLKTLPAIHGNLSITETSLLYYNTDLKKSRNFAFAPPEDRLAGGKSLIF